MNVHLVSLHPDFARSVLRGDKTQTIRPLKPQPSEVSEDFLIYGHMEGSEIRIWRSDFPCPYGSAGDLLVYHFEGNSAPFYTGKIVSCDIARLHSLSDEQIQQDGFSSREEFIEFWESIYGQTEYAYHFDPAVWVIRYCKG